MGDWPRAALSSTGTVAGLVSAAALVTLARSERKGALQPINSTSHWLHGESAARVRQADLPHTGIGFGTHHASAIFWAIPFERWLAHRPPRADEQENGRDRKGFSMVRPVRDRGPPLSPAPCVRAELPA